MLLALSGCVTAPKLDLPKEPVNPASVAQSEVIAFANLLPDELRYVPRHGGMLDLEEIPYEDSGISIDAEAFNAWEFVTESYITSSLVNLTREMKSVVARTEGSAEAAIVQDVRRNHPEVRYLVLFARLRPTTIMVGYAPMSVEGPGSINLDTVPFHGPLVNCGTLVTCLDVRSGNRIYANGFGSYEKLPGIKVFSAYADYTEEEKERILLAIRTGLRKAAVGPARKLAQL